MCRHFHAFLSSTALLCSPVNSIELVRRPALRCCYVPALRCAVLLLCPSSAMLGFLSARSKGYSSPPPCSNKTLLPSTPLPLEFQQNFIRDWVDDHKVQWTQENQYNVHQSNISDGCTRWCYKWTGLDGWISGWINNNNVYAPLNTCTWVEYNTISWIWMKWNTTQHSTQQCVCTVEHVLYQ